MSPENNRQREQDDCESTTFLDFVQTEFASRMAYEGDPSDYYLEHIGDRIPLDAAAEFAWQCANRAVALGAVFPNVFRAMFERTYAPRSKEDWDRCVAAGLDIGREQPRKDYDDETKAENKDFLAYCKQWRPQLYQVLVA